MMINDDHDDDDDNRKNGNDDWAEIIFATTLLLLTMSIMIYSRKVSSKCYLCDGDDETKDCQYVSLMNAVSFKNHNDVNEIIFSEVE